MRKIDFEAHFYTEEYIDTLLRSSRYPRMTVDGEKLVAAELWYNENIDQPFADGAMRIPSWTSVKNGSREWTSAESMSRY